MRELDRLMDIARSTLEKKRAFVQAMYDRGLYPYTSRYLPFLRNHFSTIGVNGMNEMVRNFTGDQSDLTDRRGIDMALEEAIEKQQIPGAVALVARNGKIVYHKAFGHANRSEEHTSELKSLMRISYAVF